MRKINKNLIMLVLIKNVMQAIPMDEIQLFFCERWGWGGGGVGGGYGNKKTGQLV